jgi:hypothetical protein
MKRFDYATSSTDRREDWQDGTGYLLPFLEIWRSMLSQTRSDVATFGVPDQ